MPTLICRNIIYYSPLDEQAFFEWVKRIPCISKITGTGNALQLEIADTILTDDELRELLSLFYRYDIDMKQLAQFATKENAVWFKENHTAYWHKKVFG
ncbi:MAG: hypothetical protein AB7L92_01135 [Alphaproteobacteria bacterium]